MGVIVVITLVGSTLLFEGDIPASTVDAKYSNSQSNFLTLENGSRIHYRDQGQSAGLPIVLVHGAMASLHTWEPWVQVLGENYRLVTLDLPAHGLTGQVPNEEYGADAFTAAIEAVANELGLDSFVLGGNSMGGGATWRYALENPDQVRAMVLVDSVPPNHWARTEIEPGEASGPAAFSLLRQGWFKAIARNLDPAPLIAQGLRSAYNNSPVVDDQLIARYYELIMREGTRSAILGRTGSYNDERDQPQDLSVLNQPTLIMWGAQDAVIPVSVAAQFEEILPNSTTVIYQDLGHIPMEEDPARTAADVLLFLKAIAD
ncbi:MAG: pimeloyl-ACP methyl ester carboxylesterase [Pseudohongiellaceae bacterium]|jgi:pimeloyl-ACP methyl ester carboxylesterase